MMFDDGEFDDDDKPAPSGAPPSLADGKHNPLPPLPIQPVADAALQIVDVLHPHVEKGIVSPQAALLSLALGLTRNWLGGDKK